jgi:hypothetical protein
MGFAEEIAQLGQGFKEASFGLAMQRATAGATEQVNQIKASEGDEIQKQAQLRQVSEALTRDLAQFGAPADRIAMIANSIAKPSPMYQNVDEALVNEKPGSEKWKSADTLKTREFNQQIALANIKTKSGAAQAKADQKILMDLKNDLDPNKRGNTGLLKVQQRINSAEYLDTLFKRFPDYNVPGPQAAEAATAAAALIGGGSAQSQHQIDSITPSSMKGDWNKQMNYVFNETKGLEQQKAMKLIHELAASEKETSTHQLRNFQANKLPAYQEFAEKYPDVYTRTVEGFMGGPGSLKNVVGGQWVPPGQQNSVGTPAAGTKTAAPGGNSFFKPIQ